MGKPRENPTLIYYHFTRGKKLRGGKRLPKSKVWLKVDGEICLCRWGLHASQTVNRAAVYAPGNLLHQVNLRGFGESQHHTDKVVASERRIVKTLDVAQLAKKLGWEKLSRFHSRLDLPWSWRGRNDFSREVMKAFRRIKKWGKG